jgi:hypothetical protein
MGSNISDPCEQVAANSKYKVLFTTGYLRNAIVHQERLDPGTGATRFWPGHHGAGAWVEADGQAQGFTHAAGLQRYARAQWTGAGRGPSRAAVSCSKITPSVRKRILKAITHNCGHKGAWCMPIQQAKLVR